VKARLAQLRAYFPAIAFFGGFLWDTLTIGRSVTPSDLWILAGYLAGAAGILWWLGYRRHTLAAIVSEDGVQITEPSASFLATWWERAPFLLLQFLFGGIFSALFILYFKSSSHLTAVLWSLSLGGLLIANEFLGPALVQAALS